jgi:hypothetical protein
MTSMDEVEHSGGKAYRFAGFSVSISERYRFISIDDYILHAWLFAPPIPALLKDLCGATLIYLLHQLPRFLTTI